jgi:hypothetical protein
MVASDVGRSPDHAPESVDKSNVLVIGPIPRWFTLAISLPRHPVHAQYPAVPVGLDRASTIMAMP